MQQPILPSIHTSNQSTHTPTHTFWQCRWQTYAFKHSTYLPLLLIQKYYIFSLSLSHDQAYLKSHTHSLPLTPITVPLSLTQSHTFSLTHSRILFLSLSFSLPVTYILLSFIPPLSLSKSLAKLREFIWLDLTFFGIESVPNIRGTTFLEIWGQTCNFEEKGSEETEPIYFKVKVSDADIILVRKYPAISDVNKKTF